MAETRDDVVALLSEPVPPSGTTAWRNWQEKWRAVGSEHAPMLLATLEDGEEPQQYAALLALRLLGYEAWGVGYGPDLIYRVSEPGGAPRAIKPRIPPATPEP